MKATDADILNAIEALTAERGYPPTVRELAAYCGYASESTMHLRLDNLVDLNLVRRTPGTARSIILLEQRA